MELPLPFRERMKQMLGDEYGEFLESYDRERSQGLRLNLLKTGREEFLAKTSFMLEPIPWAESGFYYQPQDRPGRHPYHEAGVYYIQEPSAMAPAAYLTRQMADGAGERILDLCAAPGGKSLHMAEKLNGSGCVEARDLTEYKVGLIQENIERTGLSNVEAVQQDALIFDETSVGKADIVLADLPCSGLGVLAKKTDLKYKATKEGADSLAKLQREMLKNVQAYVKDEGKLVYSTCTINPAENMDNVHWFLNEYPEFELIDIHGSLCEELQKDVKENGCIQLLPGVHQSDGFFLACMKKRK